MRNQPEPLVYPNQVRWPYLVLLWPEFPWYGDVVAKSLALDKKIQPLLGGLAIQPGPPRKQEYNWGM